MNATIMFMPNSGATVLSSCYRVAILPEHRIVLVVSEG
jgi:hypothetical protein